jgi:hypothetical protein
MASPASGPGKPIVDRFGGNNGRLGDMRPLPVKGKKPKQPKMTIQPVPRPSGDDKLLRTMPITEKQLGQIKKYYGVK